jgi:hypothetical protein
MICTCLGRTCTPLYRPADRRGRPRGRALLHGRSLPENGKGSHPTQVHRGARNGPWECDSRCVSTQFVPDQHDTAAPNQPLSGPVPERATSSRHPPKSPELARSAWVIRAPHGPHAAVSSGHNGLPTATAPYDAALRLRGECLPKLTVRVRLSSPAPRQTPGRWDFHGLRPS